MIEESKLIEEEESWEKERDLLARKITLKKEKKAFKDDLKMKKQISTSKLLILFLFINCTLIEIFTGWVTYHSFSIVELTASSPDFTPLVALIGAVVSEVIGYAIYALKSAKENTVGGIVYEQAMLEANSFAEDDDEEDEDAFEDVTVHKEAPPVG